MKQYYCKLDGKEKTMEWCMNNCRYVSPAKCLFNLMEREVQNNAVKEFVDAIRKNNTQDATT